MTKQVVGLVGLLCIIPAATLVALNCSSGDAGGRDGPPGASGGVATDGASSGGVSSSSGDGGSGPGGGSGGTTGSGGVGTEVPLPGCDDLFKYDEDDVPEVPFTYETSIETDARGGEILPGHYVLRQAIRAEDDADVGSGEQMRFGLRSDGTGYYVLRLGRLYTFRMEWSTTASTLTFVQSCAENDVILTYGYSVEEGGEELILIYDDPPTLLVFERQ